MQRIHTNERHTDNTLPTTQQTVVKVTEYNPDVNTDEVYQAYEVFIAEQEEREEEANAVAIAVEEWTKMDDSRRQEESDLHPCCREGNAPKRAILDGDTWTTEWFDGSLTVDKVDWFAS